jgi:hypothetical protein
MKLNNLGACNVGSMAVYVIEVYEISVNDIVLASEVHERFI